MSKQQQATAPWQHRPPPWWVRLSRLLWKPVAFQAGAIILSLVVNVASTWLTTSKGSIPADSPLSILLTFWYIMVPVAVCLVLLAALLWTISHTHPSDTQPLSLIAQDRTRMLGRLHLRYEQMLTQSLQGTAPIKLNLISRPAAVAQTASLALRLPALPDLPLPAHTSIVDVYEQARQELLILGEPGAGKSTLLLELALHLIEQAETNTILPLPILLPLSTWTLKRFTLQHWLAEQVTSLYHLPGHLGEQWVREGQVLPLLDGLDEMDETARPACIDAINTYRRMYLGPLVVCSRTVEYDNAARHERLALNAAVLVQPLSYTQVDAYLATLGKPLSGLRTALKKQSHLQELATTPLLLQVLMLTYHGTSIRQLPQKEAVLRTQIWSDYVGRMIERKGDARRYPPQATLRWLGWLSYQMRQHHEAFLEVEHLQPDWLSRKYGLILYQMSFGLLAGLLVGLSFGLLVWLFFGPLIWFPVGGLVGLFTGSLVGLLTGLCGLFTPIQPIELLTWSWKNVRQRLFFGSGVGLFMGLLSSQLGGVFSGLLVGLLTGLFIGLLGGISGEQLTERLTLSPNEGTQRSLRHGFLMTLFVGLISGLGGGLLDGLQRGVDSGLLFTLLVGLIIGLPVGWSFGLEAALQHAVLRFLLWRTRAFPLNMIAFLEDATKRGLLRRVGGGYQFIHRLLLDYFADTYEKSSTTPSTPPNTPPPAP